MTAVTTKRMARAVTRLLYGAAAYWGSRLRDWALEQWVRRIPHPFVESRGELSNHFVVSSVFDHVVKLIRVSDQVIELFGQSRFAVIFRQALASRAELEIERERGAVRTLPIRTNVLILSRSYGPERIVSIVIGLLQIKVPPRVITRN
tara:strand:- start:133 stop:576 length:444 start_codon:yes stop_codon:yes gene_type:complete